MSRIVIWSPNYAPELIGIPPLVTSAAEWLAARLHQVDVVTALPNYPDRVIRAEYRGRTYRSDNEHGVHVHRSWLRVRPNESFVDKALYEWSFALVSLPRVIRRLPHADVLVCVVPSLAAAAIATLLPRRPPVVLWVQDLIAAAAAATVGGATDRSVAAARTLERIAARRADRIIVCSPGFREYFVRLGASRKRITTVLNWVDTDEIRFTPPRVTGRTRFLYAGNLGYTQGFETLVEAVRRADVDLEIVGGGNAARQVAALATDRVTVRPSVDREEYPALLASADAHVVVQRRLAAGVNLPSKIASYLASGRPIVASIDFGTPAAELLRESGAALLVEPERTEELAAAMRQIREDTGLRAELGRRGRAFAEERLSRDRALVRIESVILG